MEDELSPFASPYTARMVTFLVSGHPISISEDFILKYPYSKLADISSYSLPGETASINWPVEDFNALIEHLRTDKIDESDPAKLGRLLKTFEYFQIPIPDHLRFKQMQAASQSSKEAEATSTSGPQSDAFDAALPTYASLSSTSSYNTTPGFGKIQTEPLTIQQKLALAVEERLTNLLMEHILPLVEGQATSGIYSGAFLLIPSNSATLQKANMTALYEGAAPAEVPDEEVISLSVSNISLFNYIKLVRLQGQQNTAQFLTQKQVIDELKAQLKARLQLQPPPPPPELPPVVQPASPPPGKKSKWGWGKSYVLGPSLSAPVTPITPPAREPISIRVEEVSMRRMNQMGLYETATGTVLVVEIVLS